MVGMCSSTRMGSDPRQCTVALTRAGRHRPCPTATQARAALETPPPTTGWSEQRTAVAARIGAPVHSEPVLINGQVSITQKYGRQGTKATDASKKQDGHWMRLGRLTNQDDPTAKAAEGQDFWIADYSPAAGTISAWILGDDGSHHEVWFSTATSADAETSRALHAARPPYQLLTSLPPGVVISDADLTSSEVPWDGPDYGYGSGYSNYGYSGYSGYSDSNYSY